MYCLFQQFMVPGHHGVIIVNAHTLAVLVFVPAPERAQNHDRKMVGNYVKVTISSRNYATRQNVQVL